MIILETLRTRPIGNILDPTIAQAVKIDAVFNDSPKPRELAWIKPETFVEVTNVNYKDRLALNQFTEELRGKLSGNETRSETQEILKNMGLVHRPKKMKKRNVIPTII